MCVQRSDLSDEQDAFEAIPALFSSDRQNLCCFSYAVMSPQAGDAKDQSTIVML